MRILLLCLVLILTSCSKKEVVKEEVKKEIPNVISVGSSEEDSFTKVESNEEDSFTKEVKRDKKKKKEKPKRNKKKERPQEEEVLFSRTHETSEPVKSSREILDEIRKDRKNDEDIKYEKQEAIDEDKGELIATAETEVEIKNDEESKNDEENVATNTFYYLTGKLVTEGNKDVFIESLGDDLFVFNSDSKNITLPTEIDGKKVVAIEKSFKDLNDISVPNGVKVIKYEDVKK